MSRIGLYYPYTHFRDANWLKLAALYWPRLARLAPRPDKGGGYPAGSPIRALCDELDFVINLDPGSALEPASRKVRSVLASHRQELQRRYGIQENAVKRVRTSKEAWVHAQFRFENLSEAVVVTDINWRWPAPVESGSLDNRSFENLIALSGVKLRGDLLQELVANNLAIWEPRYELAAVHPNFAWAYMCLLTDELAGLNQLTPVSDDPSAYEACGDWTAERFAAVLVGDTPPVRTPSRDMRAALGMMAVQLAVPANLDSVPVKKIIKIRARYRAEFDTFHDLVSQSAATLADELSQVSDPEVLKFYLELEVAKRFERPLEELRKAMKGLGIDSLLSATSIKFELPAAAAALAGGWAADQPVLVGVGAALAIAAWHREHQHRKNAQVSGSPVAYLLEAQRSLSGGQLLTNLRSR